MTDASSTPAVPVTIHRGDYRPPEWQVPDIALDFALGVDEARVGAALSVMRAADAPVPLTLRGDVRIFRLPGIYGPGRSILDRISGGRAHRIDLPEQVFSRVHVDDIAGGVIASFRGPAGIYNLADDEPCHQNRLVEWGCAMLGAPLPPLQSLDEAGLSPAARAFYAENRRVANGKAKRLLGWNPRYPGFREGLAASA